MSLPKWTETIWEVNPNRDMALMLEALTIAVEAHESIAKNGCCDKCQEAKLVSKEALRRIEELGK